MRQPIRNIDIECPRAAVEKQRHRPATVRRLCKSIVAVVCCHTAKVHNPAVNGEPSASRVRGCYTLGDPYDIC